MAVPEQTPYIEHTGNGATTSFALKFQCESKDHLIVLVDEIEPPIETWSLTGGNVVFTTAPAAGKKITLQRNTPFSRTTDYQSYNNSFRPPAVNKDFDWIWLKLQELGVADWILGARIDALKNYVDRKDDELKAYLMEEIRKQGVALDQLEDYYNRLMQKLAEIALEGGWTDSVVATWSGRTQEQKNKEFVSLHDYCKCDGTDETTNFKAAIAAAKAQNKELRAFYGSIQLSADCNLREVVFDLSPLGINMASGTKLIVGWNAGDSLSKRQYLGLVKKTGTFSLNPATLTTPTVQLMGSKCLEFKFSQIDYLQLYASTDPTTYPRDASIAYCEITGTLATRLEFATDPRYADGAEADGASSANQWINSNYFYISRLVAVDIDGSYKHNGNIFYNATIETSSARINIARGNKNRFMNTRLEGSPLITFSEATMGNIVERIWFGTQANYLTYSNVVDNGLLNKVTSVQESMSHKIDVIRLDARFDTMFNGQSGNYGYLSPSRKFLKTASASRIMYETKPFLIAPSDILDFYCSNRTSLERSEYTARIFFYDVNMQLCTNITSGWFATGNFNTIKAASGYIEGGFNSRGHAYLSLEKLGRDSVHYMSVMILASSNIALSVSNQISVILNTMRNITSLNNTQCSNTDQFKYVTSKPTAFIGKVGDVVQSLDISYRCRLMLETKLTIEAVPAASTVTVSSLAGAGGTGAVLAGDLIGIDLNDNSTHWTTAASLSGLNVTLTNTLPSGAAIGNNVYISRLV